MDKNFIKSKLLELDVISIDLVNDYIDFCMDNNEHKKILYATAEHHILPKSIFPEFTSLKINKWNSTYLTHDKHYVAHSILAKAIDNDKIIYAWNRLNNISFNSKYIDETIYKELSESFAKTAGKHWINTIPILAYGKIIRKNKEDILCTDKILFKDVKLVINSDKEIVWVNIEDIDDNYTHLMKDKNHTSKTKEKISNTRINNGTAKGANNPRTKLFEIYNSSSELIASVSDNLRKFAKEFGIPFGSIQKALKETDGILYKNAIRQSDISILKRNNTYQFKDWVIKDLGEINKKDKK
jgi:hypothetical protein